MYHINNNVCLCVLNWLVAKFLCFHWWLDRRRNVFGVSVCAWSSLLALCLTNCLWEFHHIYDKLCSRLWCWCGSVLTALLPATLSERCVPVHVISISGQPRWAYYKFREPEPWSAGGASLSWDRFCDTVFHLLYRAKRWHCTLSSDNSRPICYTSECWWTEGTLTTAWHSCGVFHDSGAGYNAADFLSLWTEMSWLDVEVKRSSEVTKFEVT